VVCLVLLLAAVVLAPIIGGGFGELTNGILQILVFAAAGAHVFFGRREKRMWSRAPGTIALGVFLPASLVSLAFSQDLYLGLKQTLFTLACLAAFFVAATIGREARNAAVLVSGIAVSALVICVTSIREYAISTGGGAQFRAAVLGSSDHWRLFGSFANPNFFAGFLVMALPVSLALYLVARRSSLVVGFGLCFVLELAALAMTGSRFGVAAAAVALIVFLALSAFASGLGKPRLKRLLVIVIVTAPVMLALSGTVRTRVEEGAAGGTQAHSGNFRVYTWRGTLRMIEANPLTGFGPGTYGIVFPRYALAGWTSHAHQGYLQLAAENGIPALGALLIALAAIGIAGVKGLLGPNDEAQAAAGQSVALTWDDVLPPESWRLVSCGLIGAFVGSMARNLLDSDWYVIGIALPFWVVAGLIVARTGLPDRLMKPARLPVIAICAAAIILSASFGLGDWFAHVLTPPRADASEYESGYELAARCSPLNPEYHREIARAMIAEARPDEALAEVDRAISLAPNDGEGYFVRGIVAREANRMDLAAQSFNRALAFKPHSTQILYELAITYREMGRSADQEATLTRILDLENTPYDTVTGVPELVDTRYARAHFYFGRKDLASRKYPQAVTEFQASVDRLERWRSHPDYIEVALAAGQLSDEEINQIVELVGTSYRSLADSYTGLGDNDRASQARAVGANATGRVLCELAVAYRDLGRISESEAMLTRLLSLENTPGDTVTGVPDVVDTCYARAHFYFGRKDLASRKYPQAVTEFQASVDRLERWRSHPDYIKVALTAGQLTDEEVRDLIGLLRDSYRGLADAYTALGDEAHASEARSKGAKVTGVGS